MSIDPSIASVDNPLYEDATKDQVRDWMTETAWIIAETQGADRTCGGCQTVMRRLDRRQFDGTGCIKHGFTVPHRPDAPNPWRVAEARAPRSLEELRESLEADVLDPEYPIEMVEEELRAAGLDPEKIGAEGEAIARDALAKRKAKLP